MSEAVTKNNRSAGASAVAPRLFVLELNAGRIHSMNTDGSDRKTIVSDCHFPDGIVVDAEAGHIYWTNMGIPSLNDGSVERADIDGKNRKTIVAQGKTHTPKQIILDKKGGKLYWCDREGMRVMRCNLDGSQLETLIETGRGEADSRDATRWCVGLTIDPKFGRIYWTQKGPDDAGLGRIFRANVEIPAGQTAATRSDIEIFYDGLPEPIDLELDHKNRVLYWTDRGDPPRGNTVNRASIDNKACRARDRGDPSHGGDRYRARHSKRSHVRDRFRRFGLLRTARWIRRTKFPLRTGQSHRHRIRRNLTRTGEMT